MASLALGGSTATEIAKKAKIPRTTVNLIIDSLHEKGLINAYIQKRRRMWVAENPEKLLIKLKEQEAALQLVMPELQSLRRETGVRPTVRTYSGADEIKQIMNDIIATKHHISAIMAWDEWQKTLGKDYMEDFIERRHRHFLKIKLLTPKTPASLELKQRDAKELRHTQFLPESIAINNSNFIYGNKVAIVSLNKNRPVGILIEDEDIHQTMGVFFESLWRDSERAGSQ